MSDRLGLTVFVIVVAQLLSAFAFIVLIFVDQEYARVALNLFGLFLALRCAIFALLGLVRRKLPYRASVVEPATAPLKFWWPIVSNSVGIAIGIYLMQLRIA